MRRIFYDTSHNKDMQLLTDRLHDLTQRLCFLVILLVTMGFIPRAKAKGSIETAVLDEAPSRPNVVFIFADDWGWGDLSCHGHDTYETPNIDRLAEQGIDFNEFTVANPVCSPSRTAIMTGHFPARHSIHRHFWRLEKNREFGMPDWLDPDLVMLPRLFKEAGYSTGHFGKWHLCGRGYSGRPEPSAYGYDESAVYGGPGPKANPSTSSTFDLAINFLRTNQSEPFFLNVWIHETHTPHFPKEEFLKDYSALGERQRVYAAVVAEADRGVGRILDTLDELELSDNTLVIFSSDNGPEETSRSEQQKEMENGLGLYYSVGSSGGLKGKKRSLYEGGVRVPFILRWPGKAPAGTTNQTTVLTAVDILPTLCAIAGIELPIDYQADGENMTAAFMGKSIRRGKSIHWEWTGPESVGWSTDPSVPINWPRLGVREGDWKLLTNHDGSRKELFHIPSDRAEERDLADRHPEVVSKLLDMAFQWKSELPEQPPQDCISIDRAALSAPD